LYEREIATIDDDDSRCGHRCRSLGSPTQRQARHRSGHVEELRVGVDVGRQARVAVPHRGLRGPQRDARLDLNGFDVVGVPAMGAFDGVSATAASLTNIAVINGSVCDWGRDGINMGDLSASGCRVEGVRASGNTRIGVFGGINSQILRCSGSNGQYGILSHSGSTTADCSASGNSTHGIYAESGGTITNCSAYQNAGIGIWTFDASTITGCSALNNSAQGIVSGAGSTITACSARGNTSFGINVGAASTVTGSTASATTGVGFATGDGGRVIGCTAQGNTSTGISTGAGSTVADCIAIGNTGDGILCTSRSLIRNNDCSGSVNGAGIHSAFAGFGSRIEGNNCAGNLRGIHVQSAPNIIIRNTCSGNGPTNWDVAAANVGFYVVGDHSGGATLGSSGGVASGSTDPNANFTY